MAKKSNAGDLKKNPANPRIIKDHQYKKLKESLQSERGKDFFDARPVIVSNRTGENIILAGNTRYQAAVDLGWKEIPTVIMEGLTEEQEQEIIIRDNVSNGEWNWEQLANEWDSEKLLEWGLEIPETTNLETGEAEEDDYEMPDEVKTDIVLGDLIEIGEHRLLCGDSTRTDTYAVLFGASFADMVLTDPPYNVSYEGKTKAALTIQNDKQGDSDFYQFLYDFYVAQATVCKAGGAWYVWHADLEGANFRYAMTNAGIMVKQCLIWVKSVLVMGRQDYQWKHEPCLYGWKEGAAHGWYSDRKQTTVLNFDKPQRNAEHPTMKPVALFAYQIGNSSKQGDIVSDAFAGSGTTMVACHQMKRKCYGMELDPKYCQVIIDRMKKLDPSLVITRNGEPYDV